MADMLFPCLLLLKILTYFSSSAYASDVDLLLTSIKPSLKGNKENLLLNSWNYSSPLCQWRGLSWIYSNGVHLDCNNSTVFSSIGIALDTSIHLLSVQLPSANLSGTIPVEIGQFSMLQSIYLGLNSISGGVPLELGYCSSLSAVDLNGNNLSGDLPPSIWNLCENLTFLNFNGNNLSGSVILPYLRNTSCDKLVLLDLGENRLSGGFPEFVLGFRNLKELDLSENLFSGSIPEGIMDLKKLERLNLSKNNFSGVLPITKYEAGVFEGNDPGLCGKPLKKCRSGSRLSSGAVAVIVIGIMAGGVVSASVLIGYTHGRRWRNGGNGEDVDGDGCIGEGEGKLVLFEGGEHFTLEEVLNATGQVMEKTYYGTMYKAKLEDGGSIGLRLLREGICNDSSSCLGVVKVLGRIRHDNLVPIRAFYQGKKGEKLLICDYLPHKSLHSLLHETKGGRSTLSWGRRHRILLSAAKAVTHLHTNPEATVTQNNMSSKNILVDDNYSAKVLEYGLEKMIAVSASKEMAENANREGYKAPELHSIKSCNVRTDVYGFGILLLEILTGRSPRTDLPAFVKMAVLEEKTMEVFDEEIVKGMKNMGGDDGLVQILKLGMGCCSPVPSLRPNMMEVVRILEGNRPRIRSAIYSPLDSTTASGVATPF